MSQTQKDWTGNVLKTVARRFLKNRGYELRRVTPSAAEPSEADDEFVRGGCVPWGPGYLSARARLLRSLLSDGAILDIFRRGGPLPRKFGYRMDERCVELPWLFARLQNGGERLLDAGSALNHDFILEQPVMRGKKIHVLTLAPEGYCFWQGGVGYLYEDLRDMPLRNELYDTVVCVSTLEHVGMDNSSFTFSDADRKQEKMDFVRALREIRRVLRQNGVLFLTVPFGRHENHGMFQQFDSHLLDSAIEAFSGRVLERTFFRYHDDGWTTASETECRDCRFVSWVTDLWSPGAGHRLSVPLEPDGAAAARAVACVVLQK